MASKELGFMLSAQTPETRLPLRSVAIDLGSVERSRFFAEIDGFAKDNMLSGTIMPLAPDGSKVAIGLMRKDIEIDGANVFDPQKFDIAFYDPINGKASEVTATELAEKLIAIVRKIGGQASISR